MKRKMLAISIFTTMLSGCSIFEAIDSLRSFGRDPLVIAATENPRATKASVMAVGATPKHSQPTMKIQGTCYDFELNNGKGTSPFYVAFNKKDQVVAAAFITCTEAEVRGIINNELPYVERPK